MHDDSNLVALEAEETARLDHLEPFVHHRRGIDRVLRSHSPRRMRERGRDVGPLHRFRGRLPKTDRPTPSARSRRRSALLADQALKDRAMLAVDRQEPRSAASRGLHQQRAGGDDQFLVGDRDVDAAFDRREDRIERDRAVGGGQTISGSLSTATRCSPAGRPAAVARHARNDAPGRAALDVAPRREPDDFELVAMARRSRRVPASRSSRSNRGLRRVCAHRTCRIPRRWSVA